MRELFDYVFLGKKAFKEAAEGSGKDEGRILLLVPAGLAALGHRPGAQPPHVSSYSSMSRSSRKKDWPRQIVANGFVLMDGKKMSKSMGNIMPLRAAIKEFGADTIRFMVVSGADLASDTDFNRPAVEGVISSAEIHEGGDGKIRRRKMTAGR